MVTGNTTTSLQAPSKLTLRKRKEGDKTKTNRRDSSQPQDTALGSPIRFLTLAEASRMTNLPQSLLRRAATDVEFPVPLKSVRFTPRGKLRFTEEQILKFAEICMNLGKTK